MKATELLERQHRDVEKLFKKIEKADDPKEQRAYFDELASNLVAHDAIERELFYPAAEAAMGMNDILGESLVEHGLVEFTLYLADESRMKKGFHHRITVLKEVVEHHVKEEESELLPKVKKALSAEENEELGARMEERFAVAVTKPFRAPLHENLEQVLQGAMKTKPKADKTTNGHATRPRATASKG